VTDDLRDLLHGAAASVDAEPDAVGMRARLDRVDRRSRALQVGTAVGTLAVAVVAAVVVGTGWATSHGSHRIASQPGTTTTVAPATTPTTLGLTPTTVPAVLTPPTKRAAAPLPSHPATTFGHCTSSQQNTTGTGDPANAGFQGTGLAGNPVYVGSQHGQTYTVVDATGHWSATLKLTHLPYATSVPIRVMCADRSLQMYSFTRTS
jgi:hypothetical protein